MERKIENMLVNNEQIIWQGKQDLKSTILTNLFATITIFIIGFAFYYIFANAGTCMINNEVRPSEECGNIGNYILIGLLGLAFLAPIFTYLQHKVTLYVITNKRLLLKSGIIGTDMRSVYYDQIKSIFVDVGIVGKFFNTGSILIDTGRITQSRKGGTQTNYDRFNNIENPYDVYKLIQEKLYYRKESLQSGRADYQNNNDDYKNYIQDTEKMKREI